MNWFPTFSQQPIILQKRIRIVTNFQWPHKTERKIKFSSISFLKKKKSVLSLRSKIKDQFSLSIKSTSILQIQRFLGNQTQTINPKQSNSIRIKNSIHNPTLSHRSKTQKEPKKKKIYTTKRKIKTFLEISPWSPSWTP